MVRMKSRVGECVGGIYSNGETFLAKSMYFVSVVPQVTRRSVSKFNLLDQVETTCDYAQSIARALLRSVTGSAAPSSRANSGVIR
jgi:hypothetical protein